MSLYKGTTLIAGAIPDMANQSLSNLNSAGQDLFDSKANKSLNNLSSTASANFDGQWVNSVTAIVVSSDLATGSYSFSVNSYLPNDGKKYEILVHGYLTISSSASASSYVTVSSDIYAPTYTTASYAQLVVTTGARAMANDLIIPVGTSREVNYTVAGATANSLYLRAYAYRRIGTNS